ncbi:MAG: ferredoxin family protein [Deltaproteobacteria bacterium]|nr:ferredoxin family protein [Deltaproteobacteria bacterium]
MAAGNGAPKDKKAPKFLGKTFIDNEVCKGCGFCIEFCPTTCLEFSSVFNRKGYHYPVMARGPDCNGCDLCGLYCPDFAIFGVRWRNPAYPEAGKDSGAAARAKEK